MPYRVKPNGNIEVDTMEEALEVSERLKGHAVEPMPDGRPLYYVLDESGEARPWSGGLIEWSDEVGRLEREGLRRLRITEVAGTEVITAFLPIDDAAATLRPGPPAVFGTIVWATEEQFFDSTRAAALARHDRVVEKLQLGQSLEDESKL